MDHIYVIHCITFSIFYHYMILQLTAIIYYAISNYITLEFTLILLPLCPPPFLAILRYSVLVVTSNFEIDMFLRGLRADVPKEQRN